MDATWSAHGQTQTDTLNREISAVWETKSRTNPQKTFRLLMGDEQVTRSETLQATSWWWDDDDYDDDDDDDDDEQFFL